MPVPVARRPEGDLQLLQVAVERLGQLWCFLHALQGPSGPSGRADSVVMMAISEVERRNSRKRTKRENEVMLAGSELEFTVRHFTHQSNMRYHSVSQSHPPALPCPQRYYTISKPHVQNMLFFKKSHESV